jgi:hypothetical protein
MICSGLLLVKYLFFIIAFIVMFKHVLTNRNSENRNSDKVHWHPLGSEKIEKKWIGKTLLLPYFRCSCAKNLQTFLFSLLASLVGESLSGSQKGYPSISCGLNKNNSPKCFVQSASGFEGLVLSTGKRETCFSYDKHGTDSLYILIY